MAPAKIVINKKKTKKRPNRASLGVTTALMAGCIALVAGFGFSSAHSVLYSISHTNKVHHEPRVLGSEKVAEIETVNGILDCGCCQFYNRLTQQAIGRPNVCAIISTKKECEFLGGVCFPGNICASDGWCQKF